MKPQDFDQLLRDWRNTLTEGEKHPYTMQRGPPDSMLVPKRTFLKTCSLRRPSSCLFELEASKSSASLASGHSGVTPWGFGPRKRSSVDQFRGPARLSKKRSSKRGHSSFLACRLRPGEQRSTRWHPCPSPCPERTLPGRWTQDKRLSLPVR